MENAINQEETPFSAVLFDSSLSSEARVKQLTASDSHLSEIKKCLEQPSLKSKLYKSNKVKLPFTTTNASEDSDP